MLHVADEGHDIETLQFGVDGVQSAHQVLEEELEGLREAEHGVSGDDEGGDLLASVVYQLALVGRGVGTGDRGWTVVGTGWHVVMCYGHQVQGRVVDHSTQRI